MKTSKNTRKTTAQEGREKRERKIVKDFFALLEEQGLTLEQFVKPEKRTGVAMPTYEKVAGKNGISKFTVMRVLQRQGYIPKRRYVLVPCEDSDSKPATP